MLRHAATHLAWQEGADLNLGLLALVVRIIIRVLLIVVLIIVVFALELG